MLAYMNQEAWEMTKEKGEAHYFSRSRNKIWHKGESSGHTQIVHSIRLDCDADTVLLIVQQVGEAACHKGYQSCFYREITPNGIRKCSPKIFDPKEVYK
jgi:phosphoribosyl-AMP cyclohydrolase